MLAATCYNISESRLGSIVGQTAYTLVVQNQSSLWTVKYGPGF